MPFKQLQRNFKGLKLTDMIDDILNENRTILFLSSLVKERLREDGTDWNEKKLITYIAREQGGGNVYSRYTIAQKKQEGKPIDKVTLEDTGDFYQSFKSKTKQAILTITADFNKPDGNISDNLDTAKVLGWSDQDIDMIINAVLLPKLKTELQKKILNGFN